MMSHTSIIRELFSWATAAAAFALVLLSACTVGPNYGRPAALASRHYDRDAEHQLAGTDGASGSPHINLDRKVEGDWWSGFRSAKLDGGMHQAIAGNLALVAADAPIARAPQAVVAAAGGHYPQLDFGGTVV